MGRARRTRLHCASPCFCRWDSPALPTPIHFNLKAHLHLRGDQDTGRKRSGLRVLRCESSCINT